MRILVTGGAGYIGSICVEELIKQNHEVIVIDNLQEGNREAVLPEAHFYQGDLKDKAFLENVFQKNNIEVVLHFAALTTIEASMRDPASFFQNNVTNGLILLDVMRKYSCQKMVFSSTAAVFGIPEYFPIEEDHPEKPINAYGESKLMFEKILDWYHIAYDFQFNSFRYFNASGASERLGEAHKNETHLIPSVIKAALRGQEKLYIFGSDYDTKDGTCIRDYLHVKDIARAHILALDNLNKIQSAKYNLGSSRGFTNLEVVKKVEKISGKKIDYEITTRRPGDPYCLVASSKRAKKELGWRPQYESLESIIESAWSWHKKNPQGYKGMR